MKTMTSQAKRFSTTNDEFRLGIFPLWSRTWGIEIEWKEENANKVSSEKITSLFIEALKHAKDSGATVIHFRLIKDSLSDRIASLLPDLGFTLKGGRVEYRKSLLDDIPEISGINSDSGMIWKTACEIGWKSEQIASLLSKVAEGDPDSDPTEDPSDYIADWLDDDVLTSGMDCIHIGFIDDAPVAMVVAQVNPKSGWSRISYMGIAPAYRGRGYGRQIHRQGFLALKAQGGKLYHGGTSTENHRMISLFKISGCSLYREMEEWVYSVKS